MDVINFTVAAVSVTAVDFVNLTTVNFTVAAVSVTAVDFVNLTAVNFSAMPVYILVVMVEMDSVYRNGCVTNGHIKAPHSTGTVRSVRSSIAVSAVSGLQRSQWASAQCPTVGSQRLVHSSGCQRCVHGHSRGERCA